MRNGKTLLLICIPYVLASALTLSRPETKLAKAIGAMFKFGMRLLLDRKIRKEFSKFKNGIMIFMDWGTAHTG